MMKRTVTGASSKISHQALIITVSVNVVLLSQSHKLLSLLQQLYSSTSRHCWLQKQNLSRSTEQCDMPEQHVKQLQSSA